MYLGNGAVVNGGTNSKNGRYWTINGDSTRSYISYGGSKWFSSATADDVEETAKVYIGTDGISLGSRFSVNARGQIKAFSGNIGGWTIKPSEITTKNIHLYANGTIQANY